MKEEKIVQIASDEFSLTALTDTGRLFSLLSNGKWREIELPVGLTKKEND